ncbi:hypothetical protein KIN20_002919 [Parelaphostrongylus tenuis]|uniref:EB domain-containing protein n=1 Tax=Parelaphostrongylus tenuis TaxID=148309 RepID=A0AAD5LZA8_PARTN|nr:hypothetical protein KIN20_002919 [Parelaphostrongylus tenuis]
MAFTAILPVVFCLFTTIHPQKLCFSDLNCPMGLKCWAISKDFSVCRKIGGGARPESTIPPSFYCNTDRDCAPTQVCVHPPPERPGHCQLSIATACITDSDCPPGQTCVRLPNFQFVCQITAGGHVGGTPCQRDFDCQVGQRCAFFHERWQCVHSLGVNECRTSSDCPNGDFCAFSTYVGGNVCVNPAPQSTVTTGGNIGIGASPGGFRKKLNESVGDFRLMNEDDNVTSENGSPVTLSNTIVVDSTTTSTSVTETYELPSNKSTLMKTKYTVTREAQPIPKRAVIDPAAMRCEFDYQCRMGESCSGVIALVDRNITVCQYDVAKVDRLCIFHADCIQGQQCRRNASGTFICTPSIEAAIGTVPCVYDTNAREARSV